MNHRFRVSSRDFDLPLCVTSGQVFRWTVGADGVWEGVDGEAVYRATVEGADYRVQSNRPEAVFSRLFRLEEDAAGLRQELVRRGPELAPLTEGFAGLRLMRPSDPTEVLFSFLCTANNHLARIGPMVRRLATYGDAVESGHHRFPRIDRIAAIPPLELRAAGFGYRADTVVKAAQELVRRGGDDYLVGLMSGPYTEAEAALRSLPYVGRKLADCIALYALHKTEAVPLDTHMWQAMTRLYFPHWQGEALTDLRYRHCADFLRDRFGDLAGYAQQLLFYENLKNWRDRRK